MIKRGDSLLEECGPSFSPPVDPLGLSPLPIEKGYPLFFSEDRLLVEEAHNPDPSFPRPFRFRARSCRGKKWGVPCQKTSPPSIPFGGALLEIFY